MFSNILLLLFSLLLLLSSSSSSSSWWMKFFGPTVHGKRIIYRAKCRSNWMATKAENKQMKIRRRNRGNGQFHWNFDELCRRMSKLKTPQECTRTSYNVHKFNTDLWAILCRPLVSRLNCMLYTNSFCSFLHRPKWKMFVTYIVRLFARNMNSNKNRRRRSRRNRPAEHVDRNSC